MALIPGGIKRDITAIGVAGFLCWRRAHCEQHIALLIVPVHALLDAIIFDPIIPAQASFITVLQVGLYGVEEWSVGITRVLVEMLDFYIVQVVILTEVTPWSILLCDI